MTGARRIFFSTDVHGSEIVWRKWLSIPKLYKVDIMILSGDLTGKAIVPIVKQKDGTYSCKLFGEKKIIRDEGTLREVEEAAKNSGHYPVTLTPEEVKELRGDPKKLNTLFLKVIKERMEGWLELLEEKLPSNVEAVVMPGNDDEFVIDPVIKQHERVIYPLERCIPIFSEFEMISLDYTNPTPWNTPRECSEKDLEKRLRKISNLVTTGWKKVICNFHCPPYGANIDLAPKLDKQLRPVSSFISPTIREHVGSKAIYRFIEGKQPLLGLHGHIHESSGFDYIKSTQVFNPGSEYSEGVLSGFIFEFTEEGIKKWWKVSG